MITEVQLEPDTAETTWTSWHLHVHSNEPRVLDDVVLDCVEPVVITLGSRPWFFIRYWQGGPHIRLRIAQLSQHETRQVGAALDGRLAGLASAISAGFDPASFERQAAGFAAAGENGSPMAAERLREPGVYPSRYEPEYERYGGEEYLALSERLFHLSSEVALQACRQRDQPGDAFSDGLLAMAAALSVLPDIARRQDFLRRVRQAWTRWGLNAVPGYDPAQVQARAVAHAMRLEPAAARIIEVTERPPAGWARWTVPLTAAAVVWAGETHDQRRAGGILSSHVHMMQNRLGIGGGREGYLASILLELLAQ